MTDETHDASRAELLQFFEQIEGAEAEKAEAAERVKEHYAEAKARGYDTRALKKVVAMRKRDRDDLAEEEAIVALYREAVGV